MCKDAIEADCEAGWAGVALYEACRAVCCLLGDVDSVRVSLFAGFVSVALAALIFIPTPADCAAAERESDA